MGRVNGEDVFIEERTECSLYIIENNFKNQKQSFLRELLFQKLQNVTRF